MATIASFPDLEVWREAHRLVLMIYQATATFPSGEQYGLTAQMRRAAVSIPANIVEGFKRRGWQEKVRFYNIAEASLEELKYFLILAHDLAYIQQVDLLENQTNTMGRLLFRFRESATQKGQPPPSPNP
jgi:four helix bundle protein